LQVKSHVPLLQIAVPLVGAEQSVHEVPQAVASVFDAQELPHG